jgi:transporter family-2 protein
MINLIVLIAVAAVAGIAVALQGQFLGAMNRAAGWAASVFITYGIGGAVAAIIWLVRGETTVRVRQIPWYAWSAGLLGLLIVGSIGYAAPRLGLSKTIVVSVAAQLVSAILIDCYALFGALQHPFDAGRAVGLCLTIAGVWLVVRG